jgi:hypothetical protein
VTRAHTRARAATDEGIARDERGISLTRRVVVTERAREAAGARGYRARRAQIRNKASPLL